MMQVRYLCDCPEYVETVTNWVYHEFVVKEQGTTSLALIRDFFGRTSDRRLPITLLAIADDGECVGTVSIFDNDLKSQDTLRPWLASLYVSPRWRGGGIARMLIDEAERTAAGLGAKSLYLRTEHAAAYYQRLGWSFLMETVDKGQQTKVFYMTLGEG